MENERGAAGYLSGLFGLEGQVAIVTGGTGVLGGAMAHALARAGARVGILGRRREQAEAMVRSIVSAGGEAEPLIADVLRTDELAAAREAVLARWGRIDILVNAAGGNVPAATIGPQATIFEMPEAAFRQVLDLNLIGTLLPVQTFGAVMAGRHGGPQAREPRGSIVNISSMAAFRALSRVAGYASAKAAVDNLTRWLADELARKHGAGLRVNAIAPGFYIGDQNRRLLLQEDGSPTERGGSVLAHTPAGRFGEPPDLASTVLWLCGPGASFVNGVVIPVDGGFGASSGI